MSQSPHERRNGLPEETNLRKGKKQKIVFWGLGSIGSRLARLIRDHFDYELVAYRSTRDASNTLGIPEIYDENVLNEFSPDIAFITNPTSAHMGRAIECASRGMHLFIEKPLSHSLEGADTLIKIIRNKGIKTYVGCNLRFDPIICHLKDSIQPERLSRVRVICSSHLPSWRPGQDYRKTYSARRDLGGGVILDLIHEPDYCAWLFGKIERVEGTAGKISNLEIETEDFADMVLFHASGVKSHVHIDYAGWLPQRRIEILGEGLYLEADLLGRSITTIKDRSKGILKLDPIDRDYTYREELQYFFSCIESGQVPMNTVEEHLSVLKPLLEFKKKSGF